MPTCPDCGSIIMEGDPYCSHCGAHLSWDNSNKDKHDRIDGRYKLEYDMASNEFRMIDEVEVQAYFRVNGKRRIFDLDLTH